MSDSYLGDVRAMSFAFAPRGWALCKGQLLAINQNLALFSLLGTTYGGDGRTRFALPALPGVPTKSGAVLNYCIAVQGFFPQQSD